MKRLAVFGVIVGVVGLTAACGDSSDSSGSSPSPGGDADTIQIGVIQEARPADQPWSAAMADSLERVAEQDGNVEYKETFDAYDPTAAEPVARQFLSGGYDVLLLHSFALGDVAQTLAPEFPEIPMSVASFGEPGDPNLSIETSSYLQIGYSNCWLLGKLSTTGTIGIVGPQPIPYSLELEQGCQLGAEAAGAQLVSAFSNSFTDQQATREQAQSLVDKGADGIFPSSGTEDSLGGFKLCEDLDLNCVGWASDARRYAPNTAVGSAIVDWGVMINGMIADARAGETKAETFNASFENKGLIPQPFEGTTGDRVPADVQQEYADVVAGLASSSIELPKSTAHPCCV